MPFSVPMRVTTGALALAALTFLVGCFRSSTGDAGSCECCGTTVEVGPGESCTDGVCDPFCRGVDLGPGPDGGPDGGATHICHCCGTDVEVPIEERCELGVCDTYCRYDCERRPVDALCDHSHIPAGERVELPVLFGDPSGDDCYCGELVECEARVVAPGELELSTAVCEEPGFFCEACNPFIEGTCSLPPLEAGTWKVSVEGADAFELSVTPPDVLPEWGLSCDTRADARDDGCGTLWPPGDARPDMVCHALEAYAGSRVPIEVTHGCPPCNAPAGPCEVDVFDDVIRVHTSTLEPACDIACPPFCEPRTDTCLTPALPEGIWRVQVAGLEGYESALHVGDGIGRPGVSCGPAVPGG